MRIALLGADDVTLAVAAAALRIGQHQIVQAADVEGRAAELARQFPGIRIDDDWQRLLDSTAIDAVLVAAGPPEVRVEQLRRLIQLAIPSLVSHPISLSMLEYYELEMIRRETACPVLAYLPARWHPAIPTLRTALTDGNKSPIGVEQLSFQRYISQRDRETVLRQFAVDADLLQFIAGDATKLHALGSTAGGAAHANLAVQMTCDTGLVCRWLVSPIETQAAGELSLIGPEGKAIFWMPDSGEPWRLEVRIGNDSHSTEYPEWDPPAVALEKLAAATEWTRNRSHLGRSSPHRRVGRNHRQKSGAGRTIDLHKEEFSDIGTFKGTMASLGCGLLIAGLVLVVFVAMVRMLAVQAGWNGLVQILDFWPYLLLAVLGIYLVLQLLVLIGKSPSLPNRQGEPDRQQAADRHDLSS